MEPITYAKAASLLNAKEVTIRAAANEGRLTKVPSTAKQLVIKEQVMLFQGKKQIRETMLSESEHADWLKYKNAIEAPQKELQMAYRGTENFPATFIVNPPDRATSELLREENLTMEVGTPSGVLSFQSALTDESDSKNTESNVSLGEAFVILLGLIVLFFALNSLQKKKENLEQTRAKVEQELQETGLEKEDLVNNQEKSLIVLQTHPKKARRIKTIIKEAGVPGISRLIA